MGTSGAYGGSGSKEWRDAGRMLVDLPPDGPEGTGDGDDLVPAGFWQQVADALAGEDPTLSRPLSAVDVFPLSAILPRRAAGGGGTGEGGGGGSHGISGGSGRSGARPGRSVTRSAARGAAAIGGAYALRSGDVAALAELGLSLDELRDLSPRMQCARILEAVLGDGGHPDEAALHRAAAEQLKSILLSEEPPSEVDAIRGFVARFVFELTLVELQTDLTAGRIDIAAASRKEGRIWRWLEARIRRIEIAEPGRILAARLREIAVQLTREAIRILRAGPESG
jgi:hypothetical protein